MENYLLIALMIVISTAQSILSRFYSTSYPGREDLSSPVFTIVSGIAVVIASWAVSAFRFDFSWQTLVFGAVGGIATGSATFKGTGELSSSNS